MGGVHIFGAPKSRTHCILDPPERGLLQILKDFAEGVLVFRDTFKKESSLSSSESPKIGKEDEDKNKDVSLKG